MKVGAVIAEYNPFHLGHEYHLDKTRMALDLDAVIVIMSGNFVQRGEPAVFDKWQRTRAALRHGADLVIELPTSSTLFHAGLFAHGAITLVEGTGCVDYLSFGCETEDLDALQQLAEILSDEQAVYDGVAPYLANGIHYPRARRLYMEERLGKRLPILEASNAILALEYLRELHQHHIPVVPFIVRRRGAAYNDESWREYYCSATAIRRRMQVNLPIDRSIPEGLNYAYQLRGRDFFHDMMYVLRFHSLHADKASEETLRKRILNIYDKACSCPDLIRRCNHKGINASTVSRYLMRCLLDIHYAEPQWIHVLGAKPGALSLLRNARLPVIVRHADAAQLEQSALSEYERQVQLDNYYMKKQSLIYDLPFRDVRSRHFISYDENK
ncbi:MAG: nucleotidyltransferase family protein [Eubacteriales bacterium]|nr:nucleotidyltransferase family protein [Eubacteriales bacterium]